MLPAPAAVVFCLCLFKGSRKPQGKQARKTRATQAILAAALLAGFPLTAVQVQAQAQTGGAVLDAITVQGQAADQRVYHAGESAGAKTSLPLRELPQSIQVVTQQTMEDLGAKRVDDLLDYVAGVSRKENHGGMWDGMLMRGFSNGYDALLNGLSTGRGYTAPRDLSGVERVEFLKGASAALYGSGEPGGTINIVSKRPLWKAAHSVQLQAGSYEFKRASVDTSAPLGENLAYRLNVAIEHKHSSRDYVHAKRTVITPALTWNLNAHTSVEYTGEILEQKAPVDRGVVALNNRLGVIPSTRFLGQPADGDMTNKTQVHQLILSHDWNANWQTRVGASYKENSLRGYATEGNIGVPITPAGDLNGRIRQRDYNSTDKAVQIEMQGRFHTAGVEHELLLGAEHFHYEEKNRISNSANFVMNNIYNPFYLDTLPNVTLGTPTLGKQRNTAFYAQDAIRVAPQWRLLLGARFDNYKQQGWNRNTGAKTADIAPSATSPRLGFSYLPDNNWTLFANAGRAFQPNTGTDVNNNSFAPLKSVAADAGAKWESTDKAMGATLTAFAIRKKNVKTADPANQGFSVTAGEVRSQGLELDVSGRLDAHWRIGASASYTNANVHRDNNLVPGEPLQHAARIGSSLHVNYANAFAGGQPWGVGAGIVHVGKRLGQSVTYATANQGRFYLPRYTVVRMSGYWDITSSARLRLDIDNLFNKVYYASAISRIAVVPGEKRRVILGLALKF